MKWSLLSLGSFNDGNYLPVLETGGTPLRCFDGKSQFSLNSFLNIVFPVDDAIADMNFIDTDDDGFVSFDELRDAVLTIDGFNSLDTNGDDLLDQSEFLMGIYSLEVE